MESHGKSVHLVTVDMDGIFLDDKSKYGRVRFARIHSRMQGGRVRPAAANGNQYRVFSRRFDHHPGVFHIAENGVLVAAGDEVLYTTSFIPADLDTALSLSVGLSGVFAPVCCVSIAYASRISDPDVITALGRYCTNPEFVDDRGWVEEPVFKLTLGCPDEETAGLLERPRADLPAGAVPAPSGHGSIDVVPTGVNKGVTLV